MLIDKEKIDFVVEDLYSPERINERRENKERFFMYEGTSLEIIKSEFRREFKRKETIDELDNRVTPINLTAKIINALAQVYIESPIRYPLDKNEGDQELLELYEDMLNVNLRMKENNRRFKQFKCSLMEVFVHNGNPRLRNLPRHTYQPYSFDPRTPELPDVIAIILKDDMLPEKAEIALWSDESYMVVDGHGRVKSDVMTTLENNGLVNPYGVLPFIYINESSYAVSPLPDDDLLRMSKVVPVLLSDLNVAVKYQAFSTIYTIGPVGDIPFSPNTVVSMEFGPQGERPEIGTVKPNVDIDKTITLITNLISMLLSTKNLKADTISSTVTVQNFQSGIAKMLDSAVSVEDRRDQQAYFLNAEKDLWNKIAYHMVPYWRSNNMLSPEFNREFSPVFEPQIIFREPKVLITDKEKIELAKLKVDSGFATIDMVLPEIYPEMSTEELEDVEAKIREAKTQKESLDMSRIEEMNGELES